MLTDILLILHIVVFGAWFGTDLATFHLSRKVLDATTPVATRATLAKVMLGVEVIARLCLPATLVLGVSLSIRLGYLDLPDWVVWPVLAVGVAWVAVVWTIHRAGGTGGASVALTTFDLAFRSIVCIAVLMAGVATVASGDPFTVMWLGIKLLAFGTIMAIGIRVRFLLRPFSAAFGDLVANGSSPDREDAVAVALRRAHPYVLGIWAMLLLAVVMAVIQPV